MELKDLANKNCYISGIDTFVINVNDDNINMIRFIIDGITYEIEEDPSDGYRSYCGSLKITNEKVVNTFPPQAIFGKMIDEHLIEFYDGVNQGLVLTIGTGDYDDYYPYCIMSWYPQNLYCNTIKKQTYTRDEVIFLLEDVYEEVATMYNDYGYMDDVSQRAVDYVKKYLENR